VKDSRTKGTNSPWKKWRVGGLNRPLGLWDVDRGDVLHDEPWSGGPGLNYTGRGSQKVGGAGGGARSREGSSLKHFREGGR